MHVMRQHMVLGSIILTGSMVVRTLGARACSTGRACWHICEFPQPRQSSESLWRSLLVTPHLGPQDEMAQGYLGRNRQRDIVEHQEAPAG